jgi:hypothetical protein
MKTCLLFALLLAVLMCGQLQAVDRVLFISRIAIKENSHGKVGKAGELGDYQMMPCNVKKYGGYTIVEALAHLDHIIKLFEKRGIDPSPFNLALAWNAGEYNVGRKPVPERAYKYARDVRKLYEEATIIRASSGKVVLK